MLNNIDRSNLLLHIKEYGLYNFIKKPLELFLVILENLTVVNNHDQRCMIWF